MHDGLRPIAELENLLPPLSRDDRERLRASIAARNHVQVPILVGPEGIIDGWHRWQISQELGLQEEDIPLEMSPATGKEAVMLGLSLNLARRHLTPEQKREVTGKLRAQRWTQQEVAEVLGMTQGRVSQSEDISNIKTNNAYIPDLRIKLTKKHRKEVAARVETGESQVQVAADYHISQPRVSQVVAEYKRREARAAPAPQEGETSPSCLLLGDFQEQFQTVADNSVDLLFTDPPYGADHLEDWDALAVLAQRILKDGAYLIAYSGQHFLPEVMQRLGHYLSYYWMFCVPYEARQNHLRLWEKRLWNAWKPMLVYSKGQGQPHPWCADVIRIPASQKTEAKVLHDWGQPVGEAMQVLQAFVPPGGKVVDPFVGSGTTLVAAKLLRLSYLGAEKSPETYARARAWLEKVAPLDT